MCVAATWRGLLGTARQPNRSSGDTFRLMVPLTSSAKTRTLRPEVVREGQECGNKFQPDDQVSSRRGETGWWLRNLKRQDDFQRAERARRGATRSRRYIGTMYMFIVGQNEGTSTVLSAQANDSESPWGGGRWDRFWIMGLPAPPHNTSVVTRRAQQPHALVY